MPIHSITGYAALAAVLGALACGGQARTEDTPEPEQAAAARDTMTDTLATERDTTAGGEAQNPPGYRGMERDTALAPPSEQTPSDTFLQNQGQGQPQDTAGYTGMERAPAYPDTGYVADTTGAAEVRDTSGAAPADTTQSLDTSGYNPSQEQPRDTTSQ
jgi:hypothetical protein